MPDEFTVVEDVTAPGELGDRHHLVDYETQRLLSTMWSSYLLRVREGLEPSAISPALRRVTYTLDNEAFAGQPLRRGIRVAGRTRRSCTFAAALWHPQDGRVVHAAEMVTVFVEPGTGAVEVPADFWAAVERTEGRSIPVTERST
ncbi:MAG TPA: hypothetical protein VK277_13320 [Acidimicrobiales bacterium]|nr:hypothetical protein [Acidimicrobiales bacterium]